MTESASYAALSMHRYWFNSGRSTQPEPWLSLLVGVVLTVCTYVAVLPFAPPANTMAGQGTALGHSINPYESLTSHGWIPYLIVAGFWWSTVLLFQKWRKIAIQRKALHVGLLVEDFDFTIQENTVDQILARIQERCDDVQRYILPNRIYLALVNLRNLGNVGDVDTILRSQASYDEDVAESGYTLVRCMVWCVPILGFVGTVIGLATAINNFQSVVKGAKEVQAITQALAPVMKGLAMGFETTLQALAAVLILQLLMAVVRRSEESMFHDFNDYCQRHLVARLRVKS